MKWRILRLGEGDKPAVIVIVDRHGGTSGSKAAGLALRALDEGQRLRVEPPPWAGRAHRAPEPLRGGRLNPSGKIRPDGRSPIAPAGVVDIGYRGRAFVVRRGSGASIAG